MTVTGQPAGMQRRACRHRRRFTGFSLLVGLMAAQTATAQTCAYVVNLGSDTVSVIDTATNEVTGTIAVGDGPNGIAVSRYGNTCVTNFDSNTLSIIEPYNQTVVTTVDVGAGPVGVTRGYGLDYAGMPELPQAFAYVANKVGNSVSVVDVAAAEVVTTIPVDPSPTGIVAGLSKVYVTHSALQGAVSVIDMATNTVTNSIPVGSRPGRIAITPDWSRLYVTNFGSLSLSVIDTATESVIDTIGLSLKPSGVAITPDGESAYVTNFGAPLVSIIPTATNEPLTVVTVGSEPAAIAHIINRGHGYTYVANSAANTVSVIDRANDNSVVATIPVGQMPFAIAVGRGNCVAIPTATPTAVATPSPTPTLGPPACAGDCNSDSFVTVDEIVTTVGLALGSSGQECPSADSSADGTVEVDDIIRAVERSLMGCGDL